VTHGSFRTIDGRPALVFERRLAHPTDVVWRAVTDPAELSHWFPAELSFDGDTITFTFPDGQAPPSHGRVLERDQPQLFAFSWGDDVLTFELDDDGDGCLLRFTHVLAERDTASRNAAGWHVCLDRLAERLGGADAPAPTGEPTDEWRAHYDAYVERGVPSGAPIPSA
jgi:uncharacterized protein YndB with AHSA1/START domain